MNGPEHYAEARRLMGWWTAMTPADRKRIRRNRRRGVTPLAEGIAAAQVHATLALTAATADLFALYGQVGDESKEAWRKALGVPGVTP